MDKPFNGCFAIYARLVFTAINPPVMLKIAEISICFHIITQRRSPGPNGAAQDIANRDHKGVSLLLRNLVGLTGRRKPSLI